MQVFKRIDSLRHLSTLLQPAIVRIPLWRLWKYYCDDVGFSHNCENIFVTMLALPNQSPYYIYLLPANNKGDLDIRPELSKNMLTLLMWQEYGYCILVDMLIWKNTLEAHVQLEFITNHDQMGKDGFEGTREQVERCSRPSSTSHRPSIPK